MGLTFRSSIVSGRTEQETRDRKQETGNRTGRRNLEKTSRRIRIEANLPVFHCLREDGTGNKGQEAGNRKQKTEQDKEFRKDIEKDTN